MGIDSDGQHVATRLVQVHDGQPVAPVIANHAHQIGPDDFPAFAPPNIKAGAGHMLGV